MRYAHECTKTFAQEMRHLLFTLTLTLAAVQVALAEPKAVPVTPANQEEHGWKITHTVRNDRDGNPKHFFECLLTLEGAGLIPYEDQLMAEVEIADDDGIVFRYEPRVWVNSRPTKANMSNYSIRLEVDPRMTNRASVGVWLNERGYNDVDFSINLKDFPQAAANKPE